MNLDVLIPVAWVCWVILLGALLAVTVVTPRGAQRSPDTGPGCVFLATASMYFLLMGAGALLLTFTLSRSFGGVLTMAILLGFAVFVLIADPGVKAWEKWRFEREYARVGTFKDPDLNALADAIRTGDGVALTRRLEGKPPPSGLDRSGHDLFGYALVALRDRRGSLDCVRALLEVGCDPGTTRMPDGRAPIHFMILDTTPAGLEAVLLLLQHGADPNAINPITGDTPIREAGDSTDLVRALVEAGADFDRIQSNGVTALVDFVASCHWESALYLVEQGARLDVVNSDGLSLGYYLDSWKESVFGEHPEGWDRLRAAIAARSGAGPGPQGEEGATSDAAASEPPGMTPFVRFKQSFTIDVEKWREGIGYDLDAIHEASPEERAAIEDLLLEQGVRDWRDVEALAVVDSARSRETLRSAMTSHDHEIALAVARFAPDLLADAERVALIVRGLEGARFYEGLSQALRQAEDCHPPPVIEALLHGAVQRDGEVAPHFAAMLMFLHGQAETTFDWEQRPFFLTFNTRDPAARAAAFRELCRKIGVDAQPYLDE